MNPFLSKPLRKIQPIGGPKNSSQEHRPSRYINPNLAKKVRRILDENKAERHIRGGMATKLKYSHLKNKN